MTPWPELELLEDDILLGYLGCAGAGGRDGRGRETQLLKGGEVKLQLPSLNLKVKGGGDYL